MLAGDDCLDLVEDGCVISILDIIKASVDGFYSINLGYKLGKR